jgi:hypothetical protein
MFPAPFLNRFPRFCRATQFLVREAASNYVPAATFNPIVRSQLSCAERSNQPTNIHYHVYVFSSFKCRDNCTHNTCYDTAADTNIHHSAITKHITDRGRSKFAFFGLTIIPEAGSSDLSVKKVVHQICVLP